MTTFLNVINELSSAQRIILILVFAFGLIRILYLLFFPMRLLFEKRKEKVLSKNLISFIFSLRNEEKNAQQTLPTLLNIDTNNFEVVAVDDFSQDNTLTVLGKLKQDYPNFKFSSLSQEIRFSDKMSRNLAIKAATYKNVMFLPASANNISQPWMNSFQNNSGEKIRIGYSTIYRQKGLYNILSRVETFFQYTKSASFSKNGFAFIYNEENVLFEKDNYFSQGGFAHKQNEPYANLELVINNFINSKNTRYTINAEAVLTKNETGNKQDFFDLLKKSIRIEQNLSFKKRLILLLNSMSEIIFIILIPLALLYAFNLWAFIAGLVFFKLLLYMFVVKMIQNRLNERKIFITSMVYSLIMPFYKIFYRWYFNRNTHRNKWRNKK